MTARASVQRLRRFNSLTANSAARAVSAMYVSDGFWHAVDAIHEPSPERKKIVTDYFARTVFQNDLTFDDPALMLFA